MGPPGAVDREFGYIVFSPPLSPLPFGSHPSKSHTYVCMLFLSRLLDVGRTGPPADANTGAVSRRSRSWLTRVSARARGPPFTIVFWLRAMMLDWPCYTLV